MASRARELGNAVRRRRIHPTRWRRPQAGTSLARLNDEVDTSSIDTAPTTTHRLAPTRVEGMRNLLLLVGAHAALVTFWLLVSATPLGLGLVLAAPIACVLHQKAMSEWLHEAAHWNFLPDRKWNDRIIQLLAGTLFLDDIEVHRERHFIHHRRGRFFAGADLEATRLDAHAPRDVVVGILRDLCGLTALSAIMERSDALGDRPITCARRQARIVLGSLMTYVSATLLLAHFAPVPAWSTSTGVSAVPAWIPAPLYLATLATIYPLFNRFRAYVRHAVDPTSLVDRVFVTSKVVLFHAEHHAHPTLPFRQLEQLARGRDDARQRYVATYIPSGASCASCTRPDA